MTRTVGRATWDNAEYEYLVTADEKRGIGVEIRETTTRSAFALLLPMTPDNLEKVLEFAARLAQGLVFPDTLPELAEDFRTENGMGSALGRG